MKTNNTNRFVLCLSCTALAIAIAAMVTHYAPAHQASPNPIGPAELSQTPVEFARRGLSLLRKEGVSGDDAEGEALKADALIMRAWNLQQAYPESCLSVWQLTQTLIDQQQEPSQRLALTSLYLNSVDAAIESAMSPGGFETSWAVRQAVRAEIDKYRREAVTAIQSNLKAAREALSGTDGIQAFTDRDSARWSSLAAELGATIEPLPNPPESISAPVKELAAQLHTIFDEKLSRLRVRLREAVNTSSEPEASEAALEAAADDKPRVAASRGPVTLLIEDLEELVRMRESASVTAWLDLATKLNTSESSNSSDNLTNEQLLAVEELRAKMLETRALLYNMWAADAIHNAERRGPDGLFLLGAIETRLLVSTVASSYSITEGKILSEIQNPFNRQVRIREMLGQSKKQLTEF